MRGSIVLAVEDGPERLVGLLEALVDAGVAEDVEVVVASAASGAATRGLVAGLEGDVRLVAARPGEGRGALIRRAAAAATADVVIVPAPEARPHPGAIEALLDAVARRGAPATAVVEGTSHPCAGYVRAPDGALLPVAPGTHADAPALDLVALPRAAALRWPDPAGRAGFLEALPATAQALAGWQVVPAARVRRASVGPRLTVALCSRDRAEEVRGAIEALLAGGFTEADGEIVVVDNGSGPGHAARLAALADEHAPLVRVLVEPALGLSRARNTALAAATCPVIAYHDDDARPSPAWCPALRDAFADPLVAIAGGPIVALFDAPDPGEALLPEARVGVLGVTCLGDADRALVASDGPWGGNWAARVDALRDVGGFDESLGFRPDSRIGSEELDAALRITRAGHGRIAYAARAAVGHRIVVWRLTPDGIDARVFAIGVGLMRTGARVGAIPAGSEAALAGHAAALLAAADALPRGEATPAAVVARVRAVARDATERLDLVEQAGRLAGYAGQAGVERVDLGDVTTLLVDRRAAVGFLDELAA